MKMTDLYVGQLARIAMSTSSEHREGMLVTITIIEPIIAGCYIGWKKVDPCHCGYNSGKHAGTTCNGAYIRYENGGKLEDILNFIQPIDSPNLNDRWLMLEE